MSDPQTPMPDATAATAPGGMNAGSQDEPLPVIPIASLASEEASGPKAPEPEILPPETRTELMTEAEFIAFFLSLFPIIGQIVGAYQPPPFQTLLNVPKMDNAGMAASAIYRIASDSPYLRWMIDKDQMHLKDGIIILGFAAALASGLAGEVKERRAAAAAAKAAAAPPQQEAA